MYIRTETDIYREWEEETGTLFYFLIWLVCAVFIILKGNINHFAGVEWLDIDLIPVFLVYFIAKNRIALAACLAFLMGVLTDVSAPCQLGLFALVYSVIVLGAGHCQKFLDFNNIKTQILAVAVFLLAKWSFLSIVPRIFPKGQSMPTIPIFLFIISVFITSLSAPLLFCFLNSLQGKEAKTGTIELL
jgi:cell shape-determining protein MreD